MSFVRRGLEWYLGLPAPAAGQRTQWRFEFHRPDVPWFLPAVVVLGLLVAAGILFIYWRDAAGVSRGKRTGLAALRVVVLAVAALCLFQATVSIGRIGLPVIALVIDDSASMG